MRTTAIAAVIATAGLMLGACGNDSAATTAAPGPTASSSPSADPAGASAAADPAGASAAADPAEASAAASPAASRTSTAKPAATRTSTTAKPTATTKADPAAVKKYVAIAGKWHDEFRPLWAGYQDTDCATAVDATPCRLVLRSMEQAVQDLLTDLDRAGTPPASLTALLAQTRKHAKALAAAVDQDGKPAGASKLKTAAVNMSTTFERWEEVA
jgi:hypothetical protein